MANERSESRSNAPLIHFPQEYLIGTSHLLGGGALSLLGQSQRIKNESEFKGVRRGKQGGAGVGSRG